jgi:bifunctional non-homologous end joining protein LigD
MTSGLLHIAGRPVARNRYEQRRALLESLDLPSAAAGIVPAFPGDAHAVAAAAASLGFEGAVLKRLGSHYLPGRRSRNWLKIKHVRVMDIVIGSWLPAAVPPVTGDVCVSYDDGKYSRAQISGISTELHR